MNGKQFKHCVKRINSDNPIPERWSYPLSLTEIKINFNFAYRVFDLAAQFDYFPGGYLEHEYWDLIRPNKHIDIPTLLDARYILI